MYRDLYQVKDPAVDDSIPAGAVRIYGPSATDKNTFSLYNTRAFLLQLKAGAVPVDTRMDVYISTIFTPGTSKYPEPPDTGDLTLWAKIHTNTALDTTESLIYERCQTSAEWLMLQVTAGTGSTLDDLDIVLAKQAWR